MPRPAAKSQRWSGDAQRAATCGRHPQTQLGEEHLGEGFTMRDWALAMFVGLLLAGGCGRLDPDGLMQEGPQAERRLGPPANAGTEVVPASSEPATPPATAPPETAPPVTAPPVIAPAVTVPAVTVPPVAIPAPGVQTVTAKQIKADRLVADIIYVNDFHAKTAQLGSAVEDDKEKRWQVEGASPRVEMTEVVAQVVYAESIDATHVEARQVFARSIKIDSGPGANPGGKAKGNGNGND